MKTQKCLSLVTMFLLLGASVQAAGVVPGKWSKVDVLVEGTSIEVRLKSGDTIVCSFRSSEVQALVVSDMQAREMRLRKEDVARITGTEPCNDSVANGLGIGFGAGAALGLLAGLAVYEDGESAAIIPLGALLYGAMGMGVGALVDYAIKGREVLYEAARKPK
jgi:hypothetical protein